jgi:hypothetical protein
MSICVVHFFGLMPSSGWDFVKAVAARNRGIAMLPLAVAGCYPALSLAVPGCYFLAAVVETPGFLRPRPGSLAVFRWMISGGSGDWSLNSPDR